MIWKKITINFIQQTKNALTEHCIIQEIHILCKLIPVIILHRKSDEPAVINPM